MATLRFSRGERILTLTRTEQRQLGVAAELCGILGSMGVTEGPAAAEAIKAVLAAVCKDEDSD